MSSLSDDTIRRVFVELQNKYVQSQQQVNATKAQIAGKQRERKLAELTRRELDGLDDDTKTYKPIGKMFIQNPLSEMKQQYVDLVTATDEEIKKLEKTHKYWERSASDAEGNLKDILQGPRN
ncbi:MAG: Prefoldin [Benjaminiella poitrasii]|nr:MAG: Prefoldin [Benjaminiella poitrasii]